MGPVSLEFSEAPSGIGLYLLLKQGIGRGYKKLSTEMAIVFRKLMGPLVLTFLCLLVGVAAADPPNMVGIKKAYEKAALGARFKFVEGMLSSRGDGYILIGTDGRRVDLSMERDRFRQLFLGANRVQLYTQILSSREAQNEVVCSVKQLLKVEVADSKTGRLNTAGVTTLSDDHWVSTPQGWKIKWCQVHSQSLGAVEPMERDPGIKSHIIPAPGNPTDATTK
ncbi:MAG: hypothetical protein U0894_20765 [Pirellulales bacterium]